MILDDICERAKLSDYLLNILFNKTIQQQKKQIFYVYIYIFDVKFLRFGLNPEAH